MAKRTYAKDYTDQMDLLFGKSDWKHRTLRTIFDNLSHEWSESKMEEKVEILRRIITIDPALIITICEYQNRYDDRPDIVRQLPFSLGEIFGFMLSPKT